MTRHLPFRLMACLSSLSFVVWPTGSAAQQRESEGDDVKTRVRAFREVRADPSGFIAPDAWTKAWSAWNTLRPAEIGPAADAAWRSIGPTGLFGNQVNFGGIGQLVSGRITSIAVHPTDSRIVWVGAASGGVWRTVNGGGTWTPLSDNQCAPGIGAVTVDPVNPNLVYAGTGELNTFEFPGCGVLRSMDGGHSWAATSLGANVRFHGRLAIDESTAGSPTSTTIMAATDAGVFVSFNSGASWSQRLSGLSYSVVSVPGRPGMFYASTAATNRFPYTTVFRTTNSGLTWTMLPTPLISQTQVARMELAVSASEPDLLFAFSADLNTRKFAGLSRWDERTLQWTPLPASGLVTSPNAYPFTLSEQGEYDLVIAVDPRNANRIWVAAVGAFASEDGGNSFKSAARTVHVDWHALTFDRNDPDLMYAGTDGGFYVSFDRGRNWRAQNNGLAIAQFYPGISVHPSGLWVFGGLQDNQAAYFSGSSIWNNFASMGDGGYTVVNYANPGTVYVTHAFMNFIQRKTATQPAQDRSNGINFQDRSGVRRPLVIDPVIPTTLYFGTHRLYRTTNDGASWTAISGDLTRGSGYITSIAVAPSNRNVIYTASSDGVISITQNGGLSYTQFVFGTQRYFTRVVVDPINPLHAIGTASTFSAPKITETHDGGASFFTNLSANLQNIPVHAALFIPGSTTLMVGAEYGVMQTSNGGASWTAGPPGLPNTVVYDLAYVPSTTTVIASTYGRGMFAYKVGPSTAVLRGDVDGDNFITANDALVLQFALVGVDVTPLSPYPRGDANCDNRLDGADLNLILRAATGMASPGACVGTLFNVKGVKPRIG